MYFKLSARDTATQIDVDPNFGLSSEEARERLSLSGANAISQEKRTSIFKLILRQLNEPMIYILFAAALLSFFTGEHANSIVILAIVLINSVIGVVQERRAEKALDALRKLTVTYALVRRDGVQSEIPADSLAVGDVVLLDAGRVVPADLRLSFAANLAINESALTGESVPATKDSSFIADGDIPLGDRINMAYQGTVVTGGRAEGIVVATGMSTEVGHIAKLLNEQDSGKTPLQKKLAGLSKILGIAAVGACILIFIIGLFQGRPFTELLMTAISLAVAVVPEGLTAVVTIVLAMGVTRMVSRGAIIRRLPAVETLGSVNVICTDKTGTLTQNKMTVVSTYFDHTVSDAKTIVPSSCLPLLHGFILCNDAAITGDSRVGDPTELALLDLGLRYGLHAGELAVEFPRIGECSFDSERKMMTTLHSADGTTLSYTKGAEDMVLPRCTHIWRDSSIVPITDDDRGKIDAETARMSE
ncbi:MAG: HAD-IC family P-type ATPase, partial [Clostridia bacterium]